jgi:MoaA/NifB/PqqE/SkfB family radical SAM enzyme
LAFKEFAARQALKQLMPVLGKMSDQNFGRALALGKKLAPNEFAQYFLETLSRMNRENHPTVQMLKRVLAIPNTTVRERLVNSVLIKHHWQGSVRRDEMRAQGLPVPGTILISPTMRCNLRCQGCYAANYSHKDDLEYEVIDRVLNEAEELGIYFISVLGGEPFVREDMWDIYEKHRNNFFQVFTNGTLMNQTEINRLSHMGNVMPVFSLEGFDAETDNRRGPGMYQKVLAAMDSLKAAGVPFGYSVMVTRQNLETVIGDPFTDLMVAKGCLLGWYFLYMPVGPNPDLGLMPTPEQRERLRKFGPRYIRNHKPCFTIDFWNDAPYVGGCMAGGRHFLHINSRGDAEPCIFIHLATDNVHQKSLRDIIASPFFQAFRDRQPYSHNLLRPCTIIDHPEMLHAISEQCHPYSTDGPVCFPISAAGRAALDKYSREAAALLDPIWEKEYASSFRSRIWTPGGVEEAPR